MESASSPDWINDDIMEYAINRAIVKYRELHERRSDIHFFNSLQIQVVMDRVKNKGIEYYNECDVKKELNIKHIRINELNAIFLVIFYEKHWSLLFYWKQNETIYHYDSLNNGNIEYAKLVIEVFQKLNCLPKHKEIVSPLHTPQQKSDWECGYCVIFIICILVQKESIKPLTKTDIINNPGYFQLESCYLLSDRHRMRKKRKNHPIETNIEKCSAFTENIEIDGSNS